MTRTLTKTKSQFSVLAQVCVCLLAASFLHMFPAIAGDSKNYVPWPMEEYEFFGLSKAALVEKYGKKLIFNEDRSRGKLDTSSQFLFTFADGKVSAVQRLTIGANGREYFGPMLKSKKSAVEYARIGRELSGRATTVHQRQRSTEKRFEELSEMLKRRSR